MLSRLKLVDCWLPLVLLLVYRVASERYQEQDAAATDAVLCKEVNEVSNALYRLVSFMYSNTADINVDGLYGLRNAEANIFSLAPFVTEGSLGTMCPATGVQDFQTIYNTLKLLKDAANEAFENLQVIDPKYVAKVRPLLEERHTAQVDIITKSTDNTWHPLPKIPTNFYSVELEDPLGWNYNESFGDSCLSKMLGAVKGSPPCTAPLECVQFFSVKPASGYYLTHIVLYVEVALLTGCTANVTPQLRPLFANVKNTCAQVYKEFNSDYMKRISKSKSVQYLSRDLFIEQASMCGDFGYSQFLNSDALQLILSWQRKSGCYGDETLTGSSDESRQKSPHLHQTDTRRKLLYDTIMTGGCSSHTSGLASEYLTLILRHRVDKLIESRATSD